MVDGLKITEGRGQRADDGRQKTEDRGQMTDDRWRMLEMSEFGKEKRWTN
jgi:hypothetical protein